VLLLLKKILIPIGEILAITFDRHYSLQKG
jgi:hypothetical protein